MAISITMPRLSDTMEEGTLVKWRVQVGDKVQAGDLLADVETDKATMELQSFDDGVVAHLAVQEGQTLPVGQLILVLAEDEESVEEAAASVDAGAASRPTTASKPKAVASQTQQHTKEAPTQTATTTAEPTETAPAGRVRVSPLARKLAEEHEVDLATLTGTGPDGRIIKRDILAAAEGKSAAPGKAPAPPRPQPTPAQAPTSTPTPARSAPALQAKTISLSNMRKTIAKRLVESKTTIPHFTVTVTVDMDPILSLRKTLNEQLEPQGVKLSVNDFILRATAMALLEHPALNASWAGDNIQQFGTVNLGVAVSLPPEKGGGLVVPVLRDAHDKGLRQLSAETKKLADKARASGLSLEEMSDGTFTISNLGMLGVDHFEGIINPPQAALLAVGAALEKPVVRQGRIIVGHEMACTLSCDHRVIDGAMAAQFLQTLKQLLERPAGLIV